MPDMRIGLLIEWLEDWRGGAQTSTQQMARGLVAAGCEVVLLTASHVSPPVDMEVRRVRVPRRPRFVQSAVFARRAAAVGRRAGCELLHAVSPVLGADLYQPRGGVAREAYARNLASVEPSRRWLHRLGQSTDPKRRLMLHLDRRMLDGPDGPVVLAVSRYVADQIARHHRTPADRVRVVFNGVANSTGAADPGPAAAEIRRQFALDDAGVVCLMVAHNFRLKGLASMVAALPRLADVGVRLVVLGRDDPRPYVEQAAAAGVSDRLVFAGPSPRAAVFMRAADVLVHPTYYDPCSRVVLEALSQGLPVVTTRHNGAAEAVTDGVEGFVIDSADDVAALGDRVGRLADAGLRRRMAAEAVKLRERLSMRRHVAELTTVYGELLEARR